MAITRWLLAGLLAVAVEALSTDETQGNVIRRSTDEAHGNVIRRRLDDNVRGNYQYEPDTQARCPHNSHSYNDTHCVCNPDYHIQVPIHGNQFTKRACLPSCYNPKTVTTHFYGGKYNEESVPCCRWCQDGCGGYLSNTGRVGPQHISRKCMNRRHTKIVKGVTMGVCDGNKNTKHGFAFDGRVCFRHQPEAYDEDRRTRDCEQSREGEEVDDVDENACDDVDGHMWVVSLVLLICLCWPGIIFVISYCSCIHPKRSVEKRSPTSESWAVCCAVFWFICVFCGLFLFFPLWFVGPFLMIVPFCFDSGYTQAPNQPNNQQPQVVYASTVQVILGIQLPLHSQ